MHGPLEVTRESARYFKCYCEENVYNLLKDHLLPGNQDKSVPRRGALYAVIVSNRRRSVLICQQRAGDPAMGGLVCWDYHVFALEFDAASGKAAFVWDFDTLVGFKTGASEYFAASFPAQIVDGEQIREVYGPTFRVVPAEEYVSQFSSDRSHMIDPKTKAWLSPPPDYDCVLSQDGVSKFKRQFIFTEDALDDSWGTDYSWEDFLARFL